VQRGPDDDLPDPVASGWGNTKLAGEDLCLLTILGSENDLVTVCAALAA
jgi:hypothetical protein